MIQNITLDIIQNKLDLMTQYTQYLDTIYSSDADIHQYTCIIGQLCQNIFYVIDHDLELSCYQPIIFEAGLSAIHDFSQIYQKNIQSVLETIRNSNHIEPETGLNVQELFTRVYDLACQPEFVYQRDTILATILDNLDHNIQTGGGCLAGICGRLTQVYFSLLRELLEITRAELYASLEDISDSDPGLLLYFQAQAIAFESAQNQDLECPKDRVQSP